MSLLNSTVDRACGTYTRAESTALTLISVDNLVKELLTNACGASLFKDVCFILVAEIAES